MTVPTMTASAMKGHRFLTVRQYWRKSTLGAVDSTSLMPPSAEKSTGTLYPTPHAVATGSAKGTYRSASLPDCVLRLSDRTGVGEMLAAFDPRFRGGSSWETWKNSAVTRGFS